MGGRIWRRTSEVALAQRTKLGREAAIAPMTTGAGQLSALLDSYHGPQSERIDFNNHACVC